MSNETVIVFFCINGPLRPLSTIAIRKAVHYISQKRKTHSSENADFDWQVWLSFAISSLSISDVLPACNYEYLLVEKLFSQLDFRISHFAELLKCVECLLCDVFFLRFLQNIHRSMVWCGMVLVLQWRRLSKTCWAPYRQADSYPNLFDIWLLFLE